MPSNSLERIVSDHNPLVRLARKLSRSAHERKATGRALLDGAHLIDAYSNRFAVDSAVLMVSDKAQQDPEVRVLVERFRGARRVLLPEAIFRSVSPVDTPTGVAAMIDIPALPLPQPDEEHWLLLDGIQDPGNLGSILRTAAATGMTRAVLSRNCADVWSPKCLRGGMGAQFVLPCQSGDLDKSLESFAGRRLATAPRVGQSLFNADLRGPVALLFGGEGSGLSSELQSRADAVIHIPLAAGVESLNVAAAVAMVCYERLRQAGG